MRGWRTRTLQPCLCASGSTTRSTVSCNGATCLLTPHGSCCRRRRRRRRALAAKLSAAPASTAEGGVLSSSEDVELASIREWQDSNFSGFESFIADFLLGKGACGMRTTARQL